MNGLEDFKINPALRNKIITGVIVFLVFIFLGSSTYVIEPGHRGIEVTLGRVSPDFRREGIGFKTPLVSTIISVSVRQQTKGMKAECYSSDMQQVNVDLNILYRIPESSVIKVFQEYQGDPFESLILPRISEAVKEVTALSSAETIVKKREELKTKVLALAKQKIGSLLMIEDIVIQNIALSKELENAIEAKMVQEQEAAKAKFTQQKAEIEAGTAVIRAKGEAEAIRVRGQALKEAPHLVQLQIVEKWDGKAPLVVGGSSAGGAANILLPLSDLKR